jgi:hypothetical protein
LENKEAEKRTQDDQPTEQERTMADLALKGLNKMFAKLVKTCPSMHGLCPDSRDKINDATARMTHLVPDPLLRDLPMNDDTDAEYFFRDCKLVLWDPTMFTSHLYDPKLICGWIYSYV